jgi:L-ascorbate metabolism protein UlaG (beta-lactamase superfamily)
VVTDPYDTQCGKFPKGVEANIVTVTHEHSDHNQTQLVGGNPFVINGPGEYEIGGVSVIGVPTWHDEEQGGKRGLNTVFVIEIDELRIAHVGDLGHKLSQEQLEEMGPVDVLMIPVGGEYTIDAKVASEVVKQVDPWVVIPMHYQQPGLDKDNFGKLTGVEVFLKEMGKSEVVAVPKLTISADRLPSELQVVVLERK